MNKTTIKALLFDLGGVVLSVDFDKVFKHWSAFSKLDVPQMKAQFNMDEPYQKHEKGVIKPEAFFQHVRDSLQLTGTHEEIVEGWNNIFGSEMTESLDAIDAIRARLPTYGFSNTNRTHQIYWEKHFPRIQKTFEKVYVSSEIGLRKPDAEAFEYILNENSIEPQELLFFDDSVENIEGADRLGIQTVLVDGSASVVSALAEL